MVTRRALLGTTVGGMTAGLAGCLNVLSDDSGSSGSLLGSFLGSPALESAASVSDTSPSYAQAEAQYVDCAGIRGQAPLADSGLGRTGNVGRSVPGRDPAVFVPLDETIHVRVESGYGGEYELSGGLGFARGPIDPATVSAEWSLGTPATSYRDYDVYDVSRRRVGLADGALAAGHPMGYHHTTQSQPSEEFLRRFRRELSERAIDRAVDRPAPDDWIQNVIGRLRPFHYAGATCSRSLAGSRHHRCDVLAQHVDGRNTTVQMGIGFSTKSALDEEWDRTRIVERFRDDYDESPTIEIHDRVGIGTVRVPTADVWFGQDEWVRTERYHSDATESL